MYKFTNGVVVFDEKTRDNYLRAGFRLVENKHIVKKETIESNKEIDENSFDNGTIEEKSIRSKKVSK